MKKLLLLAILSILFSNLFAQTTGDYRTSAATNMNTKTGWETYNGSAWVAATYAPGGNGLAVTQNVSGATSNSLSVTLNASNSYIRAGQYVTGTGITAGTTVNAISGTSLTLSLSASLANNATLTFSESFPVASCTTTSASNAVTLGSANPAIVIGMVVTSNVTSSIPSGTYVTAVSGTSLTLSANSGASSVVNTLTFSTLQTTASFSSGASTITLNTANSLVTIGMSLTITGVPPGAKVTSVSGITIGISIPTTSASTAIGVIFGYLNIPNMYVNHSVSTVTNTRQSTIGNVFVNNLSSNNAGVGAAYTNASLTIGYAANSGNDFVCNTMTVASNATLATTSWNGTVQTNTIEINGGAGGTCLSNSGTVDFTTATGGVSVTNITFTTPGNTTLSSGNTLKFNNITLNMGGNISNTLTMSAVFSMATAVSSQTLTITSGTLNITSASTITPLGSTGATLCASTGGLTLNNSSAVINTGGGTVSTLTSHTVSGALTVTAGTFNAGTNSTPVQLTMGASPASVTVNGGTLNVYGSYFVNNSGATTISSGSLNIPTGGAITQTTVPVFKLGNNGSLSFTGGSINIKSRNTASGSSSDIYISTSGTWTVSGTATFNFSDAQYVTVSSTKDLLNVVIAAGGGTGTTLIMYGGVIISNNLSIDATSVLDINKNALTATATTATGGNGAAKIRIAPGGSGLTGILISAYITEYYNTFSISTTLALSTTATLDQTNPYYNFAAINTLITATSGTGVAAGTYLVTGTATPTLTLLVAPTSLSSTTQTVTFSFPATASPTSSSTLSSPSGGNTLYSGSTSSLQVGMFLSGTTYAPQGTYITAMTGTNLTTLSLSNNLTTTIPVSTSLTFVGLTNNIGLVANGTYSNLVVNTYNTQVNVVTSATVTGALSINNTGNFVIPNTTATTLTLGGAIAINSTGGINTTLNNASNTVVFNGSSAQTIPAGTFVSNGSGSVVSKLTINNTSGVTLNQATTVSNTLTMTSGILTTTSSNLLTVASTGSIAVASVNSYISGALARVITTNAATSFPIGKGGNYRPVTFTYAAAPGSKTVTIEQFENVFPGTVPSNATTTRFGSRYRNITQSAIGTAYTVGLDNGGVTPLGTVVILRREGISASTIANAINYTPPTYTTSSSFTATNVSNDVALAETAIPLTVSGATTANKVYDRTNTAIVTNGTLVGVISPDVVTLTQSGTFAQTVVGTNITITSTSTLGGANAGAYTLTQPTLIARDITALALTVTGASTTNKVYDRTNTATVTGGSLVGIVSPDVVTLTQSGIFAQIGIGTGITITSTSTLGGANAGNYTLTQPTLTARDITALALTVTGASTTNKVYDRTNTATVTGGSLVGIVSPDVVTLTQSGTFAQTGVGIGIAITSTSTLGGANAGNYTLTQPTLTARDITALALTVTATGPSKIYGTALTAGTSTTNFSVTGTPASGEALTSVTLTPDAAGLSATTAAGAAYVVTPSLATGTGGFLASNYNITYNVFNGAVTAASLTITANNANKTYGSTLTGGSGSTAFTSSGLQNSESIGSVTIAYGTGSAANAAPATYNTITPSAAVGGTFAAANYAITYTLGNIVVAYSGTAGVWVGVTSTDFNTTSNWQNNLLPTTGTSISILSGAAYYPIFTGAVTVDALALPSGSNLSIGANTLTITGAISGTGVIKGSATSSINMNGNGSGTLYFDQTTLGTTNALQNLTINSTGTTTLGNALNLTGILTPTAGIFTTNDYLTLKSTSITGTALVGVVGGSVTGNVQVERFIPRYANSSTGNRAFRDMAPGVYTTTQSIFNSWQEGGNNSNGYGTQITGKIGPVGTIDATTGFDCTITGNPSLYSLNINFSGSNGTFDAFTNTKSNILSPFKGYRISIRGSRAHSLATDVNYLTEVVTLRTMGQLVTGDVTYTPSGVSNVATSVSNDGNVRLAAGATEYTMIGNPYVSPIDWNSIAANGTNNNISTTYNIFDPNVNATGAYVSYNSTSGVTSNPSGSQANRYIQPGQSFFVQNGSTVTTFVIREADKAAVQNGTNLRDVFGIENGKPLSTIGFALLKNINNNPTNIDGAVICYRQDFTATIGSEDAEKLDNNTENIGINNPTSTSKFSIEGRPQPTATDSISLRVYTLTKNKAYQLQINLSQFAANNLQPYLKDRFTKTSTLLRLDTVTTYAFTPTSDTNSYDNRFIIVFTNNTLLPIGFTSVKAVANTNTSSNTITWAANETNAFYYEVEQSTNAQNFTNIGKIEALGNGLNTYQLDHNYTTLDNNYYRIKGIDKAGTIKYSATVLVNNSTAKGASIYVYPNPVENKTARVSFTNMATGTYQLIIYTVSGKTVYQSTIQHNGLSRSYAIELPNNFVQGIYELTITNGATTYQQQLINK